MLELIQITNDPAVARRCEALGGMRVFVDLESLGKAERQAGRDTFLSTHRPDDVARVRAALRRTPLMVRVNPLHDGTAAEVDDAIAGGADLLMLPMFDGPATLDAFLRLVAGRRPVVALLETAQALVSLEDWAALPGLAEIYVGLNDLHLSLRCRFMFEPLADGTLDRVAAVATARGLRFGFGGIARMDEGLLPGRDVLAEHVRLGSSAVILSRTFHREGGLAEFEREVAALREAEEALRARTPAAVEADRDRIRSRIREIAQSLGPRA